jgi:hypothetical protein
MLFFELNIISDIYMPSLHSTRTSYLTTRSVSNVKLFIALTPGLICVSDEAKKFYNIAPRSHYRPKTATVRETYVGGDTPGLPNWIKKERQVGLFNLGTTYRGGYFDTVWKDWVFACRADARHVMALIYGKP